MSLVEDVKAFTRGNLLHFSLPLSTRGAAESVCTWGEGSVWMHSPPEELNESLRGESIHGMRFSASLSWFFLGGFAFALPLATICASPARSEAEAGEKEEPAPLPLWENGDCRESFDVRLWPGQTVRWLEQENLRDLIADPSLPDEERTKLKHHLGLSRGWRMHTKSRIAEVN